MEYGLEIEFLGTGTSAGVPQIGCQCEVCRSADSRDNRTRSSAIVRYKGVNLLIDCGPDFRTQMLRASDINIDALLVTHIHYDHVGGMDDLRAYCSKGAFPVYARRDVIDDLREHMPYCFAEHPYPGVPNLDLREVGDEAFAVNGVEVEPIPVMHGPRLIVGYRIGPLAYITDAKTIEPNVVARLKGIRLLVVNALHAHTHHSHMNLDEAKELVARIDPGEAYFIHMSHHMGLHARVSPTLGKNLQLAHDGLIVRV